MCKRLGIDIDNCLTNLDLTLNIMADYYGKEPATVEEVVDYNLSSVYGITAEQSRVFWEIMEYDLCAGAEVNQERLSNFYRLFARNNTEIYIITNRDEKYRGVTESWLKDNNIPYKELLMTSGVSKVAILNDYQIDIMIDDKPSLFIEAIEEGIKTKMVCVDYPYNKHVDCYKRLDRSGLGMSKSKVPRNAVNY